ncbi:MAG: glycosyltransferase family 2 protein [Methylophilus sp.]|uniref:glycosyltransferase family 2 protein n=1 Tax=Methylophilus sp. TaxID=29541 RepID=UPI003FA0E225
MVFTPCIIIPIYNHGRTITATVNQLASYQYPILIVDDGSDEDTQAVLADLAASCALVTLYRLPQNRGKGAAVVHGLTQAESLGFTHGLQIDADGQHAVQDVARFMQAGSQAPQAVILGKPVYDDSVPKSRLYGRYVTHVFVWLETLSFEIKDSMCGFRLYPLAAVKRLLAHTHLPERMDFDTAIAVRLAWQGVRFVNVATRVVYPADGLSHFDLLHDNVRITKMHTRLCLGMLWRAPLLLARKLVPAPAKPAAAVPASSAASASAPHWSSYPERGSSLGMTVLLASYRWLGKPIARLMLYPIVFYFLLTNTAARQSSQLYLQRLSQSTSQPTPQGTWAIFQHMLMFARSALDKFSAWIGDIPNSQVTVHGLEHLSVSGQSSSGQAQQGALIVSAHLGNIEMARALAVQRKLTINAVVYTEHAQRFNTLLAKSSADFGVNLLQVSQFGPDTAVMLKEKIEQGELVVIMGDRTPPAENGRVVTADFLGYPAQFAQGPWILASLLECPVFLMFCLSDAQAHNIFLEPFAEQVVLPRKERQQYVAGYAQRYAQRLEAYCRQYPLQWFNFFNFWK